MFNIPNNIHFIWIGSPQNLKKFLTPENLKTWQKFASEYDFTLWFDSRYVNEETRLVERDDNREFKKYFQKHGFDISINNILQHFKVGENTEFELYTSLVASYNPAIAKDVITPFILKEHGGFQYDIRMLPTKRMQPNIKTKHGFVIKVDKDNTLELHRMGAHKECALLDSIIALHNATASIILNTAVYFKHPKLAAPITLYVKQLHPKLNMAHKDFQGYLGLIDEYIQESKMIVGGMPTLGAILFNPNHRTLFKRTIGNYITGSVVLDVIAQSIKQANTLAELEFKDTPNFNIITPKQKQQIAVPFEDKCLGSVERDPKELFKLDLQELRDLNRTAILLKVAIQYAFIPEIRKVAFEIAKHNPLLPALIPTVKDAPTLFSDRPSITEREKTDVVTEIKGDQPIKLGTALSKTD